MRPARHPTYAYHAEDELAKADDKTPMNAPRQLYYSYNSLSTTSSSSNRCFYQQRTNHDDSTPSTPRHNDKPVLSHLRVPSAPPPATRPGFRIVQLGSPNPPKPIPRNPAYLLHGNRWVQSCCLAGAAVCGLEAEEIVIAQAADVALHSEGAERRRAAAETSVVVANVDRTLPVTVDAYGRVLPLRRRQSRVVCSGVEGAQTCVVEYASCSDGDDIESDIDAQISTRPRGATIDFCPSRDDGSDGSVARYYESKDSGHNASSLTNYSKELPTSTTTLIDSHSLSMCFYEMVTRVSFQLGPDEIRQIKKRLNKPKLSPLPIHTGRKRWSQ